MGNRCPQATVSVSGHGTTEVQPDIAKVSCPHILAQAGLQACRDPSCCGGCAVIYTFPAAQVILNVQVTKPAAKDARDEAAAVGAGPAALPKRTLTRPLVASPLPQRLPRPEAASQQRCEHL